MRWKLFVTILGLGLLLSMPGCGDGDGDIEMEGEIAGDMEEAPAGPAQEITQAYQIEGFGEVAAIRFTFHTVDGADTISRRWVWYPTEDSVQFTDPGDEAGAEMIAYNRANMNPAMESPLAHVDRQFINDQYWLLFPFHLAWDDDIELVEGQVDPLPIGPGEANKLSVSFSEDAGYRPANTYELYYDPDYFLMQWAFHRGGADSATVAATWEQHAKVGPVIVSLLHNGENGEPLVWFDDVAVALKGAEDTWMPAVPIPE